MLRSIRWRLVASYVLLAVLAVSVVGVLAFTLTRQSLECLAGADGLAGFA